MVEGLKKKNWYIVDILFPTDSAIVRISTRTVRYYQKLINSYIRKIKLSKSDIYFNLIK